jgi:hypothetical protein
MKKPIFSRLSNLLAVCFCVALLTFPAGGRTATASPLVTPGTVSDGSSANVGYLAIPPAAFHPGMYNYNYQNHGRYFMKLTDGYTTHRYYAAVLLPDQATVTSVAFHFYDDSPTKNASAALYMKAMFETPEVMASGATTSNSGYVQAIDTSIDYPVIDNSDSVYWIETVLPESTGAGGDVWGCSVFITYQQPATEHGVLGIPAVSFTPYQDGYTYSAYQDGSLVHYFGPGGSSANGIYLGAVNLPHGAVVEGLRIQADDGKSGAAATVTLKRADQAGNPDDLASVSSADGQHIQSTTSISNATINNSQYRYWVQLDLPQTVAGVDYLNVYRVKISYTTPHLSNPISLSNAGFVGFDDGYDFENHGGYLFHMHGEGGSSASGVYVAPVYLPDGAIVCQFTAGIYDASSTLSGEAHLIRTRAGVNQEMAAILSSGSAGLNILSDDSISYEVIDNSYYSYYVYWYLPVSTPPVGSGDVVGYSMRITLKSFVYLPLVRK